LDYCLPRVSTNRDPFEISDFGNGWRRYNENNDFTNSKVLSWDYCLPRVSTNRDPFEISDFGNG